MAVPYPVLATLQSKGHIEAMKTARSKTMVRSSSNGQGIVLGRSAASGRFVLLPATSKGATISIKEAGTAVRNIASKRN